MRNTCPNCGKKTLVADLIGVCVDCLRKKPEQFLPEILKRHQELRKALRLPAKPPESKIGKKCGWCLNDCRIAEGERGFCGARWNQKGRIVGGTKFASVSYYYDPLPSNCVADWVCPGGAHAGFPDFSYTRGPEYGYLNLAVFYHACTFHCLNCQNWQFRKMDALAQTLSFKELAEKAQEKLSCICYFGGDPTPFMVHSILAGKEARKGKEKKILRICWETNGGMSKKFLKPMLKLAILSGGVLKFDLKAFSEPIHLALTGATNKQTLANFAWLAKESKEYSRTRGYPVLVASTLLVPGMIEDDEVFSLAKFIAELDPQIPYALLAFHPDCHLSDLPPTSRAQAESCLNSAKKAGILRLRLGNRHLLV